MFPPPLVGTQKWLVVSVLGLALLSAAAALQNRASTARLRHYANVRIVAEAESIIAGVTRMTTDDDGEPCVYVYLNTVQQNLRVARRRLRTTTHLLPSLFDCYATACLSAHVRDALKADVWNCLGAILEESLCSYVAADALSSDSSAAAASLAMCTLLQKRYNVTHFLSCGMQASVQLHTLDSRVIAAAQRKNQSEGSTLRSVIAFAQLLRGSCSASEPLLLCALALVRMTHISRLLVSATPFMAPSNVMYATSVLSAVSKGVDGAFISWKSASCRVLASMPGRLLAGATVGALFSHLFAAAHDAASDELVRHLRATITTDTILALARFDFVADAAWDVPHRVYSALSDATNFSLADVDRLFHVFAEYTARCRTTLRAPLSCLTGWMTRQAVCFVERQWQRAIFMRSFVDAYTAAMPLSSHCASHGPHQCLCGRPTQTETLHPVRRSSSAPQPSVCHHGLQLLLLAGAGGTSARSMVAVRASLAMHTRWPLFPAASARATERALKALSESGSAALQAKYTAALALSPHGARPPNSPFIAETSATHVSSPSPLFPAFPSALGLLRSRGEERHQWQRPQLSLSSAARGARDLWAAPSIGDEVVDKVFVGLEGLPLMIALAMRRGHQAAPSSSRPSRAEEDDDGSALEAAFEVTRTVECGDVFAMPPARPFSSASAFQFDVEVAQLRYREYGAYVQSVAAIRYVQHIHTPLLDHCWLPQHRAAPSWRVTFDRVCFRYPGSDTDVLRDVSFDVASGGFLGIVGCSGAGKSTLLLLISRVFAPTTGQIYINGWPIDRLPPRALRRRLGVAWQGDGHTAFLDGLSVESNVAYGALHRASGATIAQALSVACVDDVVAARPHGTHEVLQSSEWSGGELERLSLARALMVTPEEAGAYLFDECASGLDAVTEAHVFSNRLRAHRDGGHSRHTTQIMVSHRLSSVQGADEILVLALGRVVQRGTWSELLASPKGSLFRALYDGQILD
ncbi:ABC transporter family-like protein [Leptomonas pyrrhocoris]|uniref:ABC transporter family-like protein n=1 Tax=Leptomonas pyrrhocoris TaxID=157538 RepID=A0A0N1J597_LEPPY|nr:ABC transporter family-like protein [Leptomonas pyrrhocoris]KPA84464.1 ABC transporter family-like protein [Leptomonas pyrrhocoris]|eukprot:XP_015662903.1 ABC transporter family-like protein [Leptomonas pyrrhocoris]